MTVSENIRVAVAREHLESRDRNEGSQCDRSSAMSTSPGISRIVFRRSASRSEHLLELAKAFAVSPRLLILDEPTAPLAQDSVELLFGAVRRLASDGVAVVYITHRLAEVREIADRVTVLRDGKGRGTVSAASVTDAELLAMIIGRTLEATFPQSPWYPSTRSPFCASTDSADSTSKRSRLLLYVERSLASPASLATANDALLRAVAGLDRSSGRVEVGGKQISRRALRRSAAFMPADRLTEGLMVDLNVRENTALTALDRLTIGPVVSRRREVDAVESGLTGLAVRAPSLEAPVSALSGGNQQKVVMSRALLSRPAILVADEPTQGVDVGARAEIYRILREVADQGVPVVIASSDTLELEGLCDRVVVMSRGHAVADFRGRRRDRGAHRPRSRQRLDHMSRNRGGRRRLGSSSIARFIEGDYAPVLVLAAVMIALGAYVWTQNDRYLSDFNITSVMFACAPLASFPRSDIRALTGRHRPLRRPACWVPCGGRLVLHPRRRSGAAWALGFGVMFACAIGVGLVNGALIRFANFTAVAATLVTYIALGGLAFTLRDAPDGYHRDFGDRRDLKAR